MAFFGVTLEKIEKVWAHPNADKLCLAKLKNLDFQFVVPKNIYKPEDEVVYFPLDSVLPVGLIQKMGMENKFSGTHKNRIKSVSLRGEISQGFVISPEKILTPETIKANLSSEDLTLLLGVTKYESPVEMTNNGTLTDLPSVLSKYDIEGADRYTDVVTELLNQEVIVSEKMEGTNFSVYIDEDSKIFVNQRNNTIIENEGFENSYWKVARDSGLLEFIKQFTKTTIYCEFCGPKIQGNYYGLKHHTLFLFDINMGGKWLSKDDFLVMAKNIESKTQVKLAPTLFEGKLVDYLQGQSIQLKSNGKSIINSTVLREGIVVKPALEQYKLGFGRLIIKQRSPEYLANED